MILDVIGNVIRTTKTCAPLLGSVHAGGAKEPEVLDDRVPLPYEVLQHHKRAYFLEVEGDCMSRVYPEGCRVLIDPDRALQSGSIAVVSIDGADYIMRRMLVGAACSEQAARTPASWKSGLAGLPSTTLGRSAGLCPKSTPAVCSGA